MKLMKWNQTLVTGLHDVDRQHQWLLNLANQLHEELSKAQPDKAFIGQTLNGLMDYTVNHFVAEESLFERIHYPQAAIHKAMHDRFTAQVMRLIHDHEDGKDIGKETLSFLKDWLLHHIRKTDMAYVPYVPKGMRLH